MKKSTAQVILTITFLLIVIPIAFAHEEVEEELKEDTNKYTDALLYIKFTAGLVIIVSVFLILKKEYSPGQKKFFFWIIAIPVIFSTLYLAGSTIYENITSVTKGPIHWHAHYQIWVCEERLDLIEATGLSNKIGSSILHSHDDDSIHVEGVVQNLEDISLKKYFEAIGGKLDYDLIYYPTANGLIEYHDDDQCPDGNSSTLQVYVNGKRIDSPQEYVIAHEENVPPGDCIIFDFGSEPNEFTEKICDSWVVKYGSYDLDHEHGVDDDHEGET